MKKEFAGNYMQDKPNKPRHRDLIRGKGLARGLSLEDKGEVLRGKVQ